jgi:hypothetical protein
MKAKTIRHILRAKIGKWIESIKDERVRKLVKRDTIVTGGCITSMLLNEKINDFDIYFMTRETTQAVAEYYLAEFIKANPNANAKVELRVDTSKADRISIFAKSVGIVSETDDINNYQYFETRPDEQGSQYVAEAVEGAGNVEDIYEETKEAIREDELASDFRPVFMSTNAITLSGKVQIVLRFYGKPEEIHGNYDFVHCTNYWTASDDTLVLQPKALEAILARELVYVGSKYPVCSIIRLRKFIKRGWTINAGQIVKMVMQINELDLNNIEVLRDQLTGVDSAYFAQVLSRLEEKNEKRIDSAYLIEIIDRIF